MSKVPLEIREARLGQLIREYPEHSYSFYNPILKQEFGEGIRKKVMLRMIRETRTSLLMRGLDNLPKPKHPLAGLPDAPRLKTEKPNIRRAMRPISHLRSEKYRRDFYADIKFRKKVTTKKKGARVKYTSIYLGTYTPREFRIALYNGTVNKDIKRSLRIITGESLPYSIEGFWATRRKEKV